MTMGRRVWDAMKNLEYGFEVIDLTTPTTQSMTTAFLLTSIAALLAAACFVGTLPLQAAGAAIMAIVGGTVYIIRGYYGSGNSPSA